MTQHYWDNNELQFARLICELMAEDGNLDRVASSMGLSLRDVNELLDRAHAVWERGKKLPDLHEKARNDLRMLTQLIGEDAVQEVLDEMMYDSYEKGASASNNTSPKAQVYELYESGYTLDSHIEAQSRPHQPKESDDAARADPDPADCL